MFKLKWFIVVKVDNLPVLNNYEINPSLSVIFSKSSTKRIISGKDFERL